MKRFEYLIQEVLKWGTTNPNCMIWPYAKSKNGYGSCWAGGTVKYTHVLAYSIIKGEIPEGMELDHNCETVACFNPAHLDALTRSDHNVKTWVRMGGHPATQRTHCPEGHELIEGNLDLYRLQKDGRICLECKRRRGREYMRRKRSSS